MIRLSSPLLLLALAACQNEAATEIAEPANLSGDSSSGGGVPDLPAAAKDGAESDPRR